MARSQRMEDFLAAVRTIYASTMSERALRYREQRDMLDRDEQMALLVMRVSGKTYGRKFYPLVAGVGFSFNPYVWDPAIDPEAGVIRLVFGLGTRAVDRMDDDYTRLVACNAPNRRPEHSFDEVRQYTQRRVDYIDLDDNHLASGYFHDLVDDCDKRAIELVTSVDTERVRATRSQTHSAVPAPRMLSFDQLLGKTDFVDTVRTMMRALHEAYNYPVDIEFTTNVDEEGAYRINLVQRRPLQVQGAKVIEMPAIDVPDADRIISARSAIIGQSRIVDADTFIYVVPDVSLGTHFLNELVEMDMLYLALFPGQESSFLDEQLFLEKPSILLDLVPSAEKWQHAVRVLPAATLAGDKRFVTLTANAIKQEVDCFRSDLSADELPTSGE